MEFYEREYFVSRLLASYIILYVKDQKIKLVHPTYDMMYDIQDELTKIRISNVNLITRDELVQYMMERELWSADEEHELSVLIPENLEKLKIGLYESYTRSAQQRTIRKYIKETKYRQEILYKKKFGYDYMTLEGYLQYLKNSYVVYRCAINSDGSGIDWSQISIEALLTSYYKQLLSSEQARELARTQPWTNFWQAKKVDIFNSNYLTSDQHAVLSWSKIYDNIAESAECPPSDVIEDDDMLDGWLILQRKKSDELKGKKQIEDQLSDKVKNADDIFIVADTVKDAHKITSLNDPRSSAIKRNRLQQIKQQGLVKEQNLADVKMDRAMQFTQAQREHMRRR